jgi:hypothetical protein
VALARPPHIGETQLLSSPRFLSGLKNSQLIEGGSECKITAINFDCVSGHFAIGLMVLVMAMAVRSERKVTKLAYGVFEIQHDLSGNTTVTIGDRPVFVVDAFLPSQAREDIAQIHPWTDKPISVVLNTHFHNCWPSSPG